MAKDSLESRSNGQDFSAELEDRARAIVARANVAASFDSIVGGLEREIALVLEQIDQVRRTGGSITHSLLQAECYVDTELIQMELRAPRYSPERYPEREKLQRRLIEIERERRDRCIAEVQQIAELHKRLLDLLNQHAVLTGNEWISRNSRESSRH